MADLMKGRLEHLSGGTVIVVTRKTWYTNGSAKWETILAGRELEESVHVDEATWVLVFAPR